MLLGGGIVCAKLQDANAKPNNAVNPDLNPDLNHDLNHGVNQGVKIPKIDRNRILRYCMAGGLKSHEVRVYRLLEPSVGATSLALKENQTPCLTR